MTIINSERLLSDLRELARFGAFETGVDRVAFSTADLDARRWLVGKLEQAGLDASMDTAGNVFGRDGRAATAVLVGSHSDTVPKGGWLDGALGVIYGLEIARSAIEAETGAAVGIDVMSFQDEEGTYLSCFGSRIFCGGVPESEIAAAQSRDGKLLTEALRSIAAEAPYHRVDRKRHLCYLEAHIEQGPRLEAAGKRIAVVTGLVGIRRLRIRSLGRADHAGTTPMIMRRDAGAALIRFAAWVADEFPRYGSPDTVWNIGSITFLPGAPNVVPEHAELILEFRDTSAEVLDLIETKVMARIQETKSGAVPLDMQAMSRIPPTMMAKSVGAIIADAASKLDQTAMHIPSGAGHDAMIVAGSVPAAMMFVPSIGGRSHNIDENTRDEDIVLGCRVLAATISHLRTNPQAIAMKP